MLVSHHFHDAAVGRPSSMAGGEDVPLFHKPVVVPYSIDADAGGSGVVVNHLASHPLLGLGDVAVCGASCTNCPTVDPGLSRTASITDEADGSLSGVHSGERAPSRLRVVMKSGSPAPQTNPPSPTDQSCSPRRVSSPPDEQRADEDEMLRSAADGRISSTGCLLRRGLEGRNGDDAGDEDAAYSRGGSGCLCGTPVRAAGAGASTRHNRSDGPNFRRRSVTVMHMTQIRGASVNDSCHPTQEQNQ